jgi:hypothetical protein
MKQPNTTKPEVIEKPAGLRRRIKFGSRCKFWTVTIGKRLFWGR